MKIFNSVGVLLCGGKSRRMGFDKAFLKIDDHWLLLQQAKALSEIFSQVVLVSNSIEKFQEMPLQHSYILLEDHYPETGPLGAIATAMEEVESEFFFVMACDMPFLDPQSVATLQQHIKDAQVVLYEHQGKQEPLLAFYHKSCLPVFQKQLDQKQLRIRAGFQDLNVQAVKIEENEAKKIFLNLNTPKDVEQFRNHLCD